MTTRIRRGMVFATTVLEPVIEVAQEAESAGFDRVWTTEYVGRDAIARALAIAMRTTRIRVGTGVAYAFARLPLAMAALASDVQRLSEGRFDLGLSAGTRGVRRWFGAEFDPPAPTMAAYVDSLREIWAKSGEYADPPSRIYLAAFNEVMTRHSARVADGVLLHPLAAGGVHFRERILPAIERGSRDRVHTLEIVAWRITSIDVDEELARARAAAQLAFYLSTPSYSTALDGTEWEGIPRRVQEAFSGRDVSSAPPWLEYGRAIPDAMIDEFALVCTPSNAATAIAGLEADLISAGIDEVVLQTVGAGLEDQTVIDNCRLIASSFARTDEGEDDEQQG